MSKHTSLPWFAYEAPIQSEGGIFIRHDNVFIARIEYDDVSEEEAEANKILILAAPHLLKALKKTVSWLEPRLGSQYFEHSYAPRFLKIMQKAIAKAEGTS